MDPIFMQTNTNCANQKEKRKKRQNKRNHAAAAKIGIAGIGVAGIVVGLAPGADLVIATAETGTETEMEIAKSATGADLATKDAVRTGRGGNAGTERRNPRGRLGAKPRARLERASAKFGRSARRR